MLPADHTVNSNLDDFDRVDSNMDDFGAVDSNIDDLGLQTDNFNENNLTIIEPYLTQEFQNLQEVFAFYNSYALKCGFGIRKSSSSKSQASGELIWKKFECNKTGFKIISNDERGIVRRRDTKVGCHAKLEVRMNKDSKWSVTQFVKEHNHPLDTPQRTKRHRSHNTLHKSSTARNLMDQLHDSGLGPSTIAKALNTTDGNPSISTQNVIDHLRIKRKNNMGSEGVLIASYLNEQITKNSNFYYALELDVEGFLRSIFWVDARAREDFFTFGDVIIFDVTYKTNNLMMPFAPFTGVNHHRQSTLFGCALLADETEETFVWLFEHWLQCMFGKAPNIIITDMDSAMYKAIKKVFPNTRHRFCSWHINKHLIEHVHAMRDCTSEFSNDYRRWLNSKYISSSERRWQELVVKYHINEKDWLSKMWKRRFHWVPAYLKDVFVAGMTSSGRSESMNSFFDGFVNSNTRLIEFIKQYEKAVLVRREAEVHEDFKTMNSKASLISQNPMESHAGEMYTRKMFLLFQKEFKMSLDSWHIKKNQFDTIKVYGVGMPNTDPSNWSIVTYNESEDVKVTCDCCKFETEGFLCSHILHIMVKKQLTSIPEQYILKRWTINARHLTNATAQNHASTEEYITPIMKWTLASLANKVVEESSKSYETYMKLYSTLNSSLKELTIGDSTEEPENITSQIASTSHITNFSIRDPTYVKTKGRPKSSSRIHSGL